MERVFGVTVIESRLDSPGHLNNDADDAARSISSAGLPPRKASGGGLGLRELITAAQAHRLPRSKQMFENVFGDAQPHGETCAPREPICDVKV